MAGLRFFKRTMKLGSLFVVSIAILALGGCGQGNGPQSFPNQPATPLPPGGGDGPPFDSGLLTNGDFEAGVEPWIGNAANVELIDGSFVNFADVGAAGQPFDVNLSQVVGITEGETYTLTFKARSNGDRTILAGIGLNEEPFTNITETVNLKEDWQTFQYDFTATFGILNSRVLFDMGADTGQVIIDDVSLVGQGGGPGVGTPIDPDVALYRTEGDADLVPPDDYDERTGFGSGSVIEDGYADDDAYSPVLSVFSGAGYGANVAQVGFIGFRPGFLGAYESVDFKVRGMPNFVIFVKLFDGIDALRINLTSSDFSEDLGNGWFQVSIPVSKFRGVNAASGIVFESDDSSLEQFRMLLTDIGFSGEGDNPPEVADPGIIPDDVIYATDPNETVDLVATITAFGTSSNFNGAYALDADFNPAFLAESGSGYGLDHIVQLGFVDLGAGFATGYESFSFKIKSDNLPNNTIIVKLEQGGEYGNVLLTDASVSTPLGNGWYQVVLPMSDFANVDPAVGILFEAVGPQTVDGGTPFSFLATDIGFNNPVAGGGGELVVDGGFEAAGAAGLQPPWFVFDNGGTVSVSDVNNNGGTYAARLQADASSGAASFPILKVERLGTGTLTDGGPVTVSFDAIDVDNVGVGKVFVAEFFTERSDPPGGATNEVLLGGYGLSGAWQTFTFNTNLGADAAGGVSLLFKADCGANPACTMDVFIDNVSIEVN